MCYDIKTMLKRQIAYCSRYFPDSIPNLMNQLLPYLEDWEKEHHHASGFAHPEVFIYTAEEEVNIDLAQWGLIPEWIKTKEDANKFWNNTINARCESMFEKPSFKESAKKKRCIVFVDGFFEHQHLKGEVIPHYIERKDGEMMAIAGLWTEWENHEDGTNKKTFSILTTKANRLLSKIHNNPKLDESRMPVILEEFEFKNWMNHNLDPNQVLEMCKPHKNGLLKAHTVKKLRGKDYLGNVPEVTEEFIYPDNDELTLF